MSVTSSIVHPPNERLCIVRESYQAITGNDCEAALLNVFEQWHKWKTQNAKQARSYNDTAQRHGDQPSQLETVYIWNTATELSEQLLGLYKETTVKTAVKSLATKGFITIQKNPNPAYGFDRKNYYTFEVEAIQAAIDEMFFAKTPNAKVKNDYPLVEIDLTLVEIDRAITKNSEQRIQNKELINNIVETSSTPVIDRQKLKEAMEKELAIPRTQKVENPKDEAERTAQKLGLSVLDLCEWSGSLDNYLDSIKIQDVKETPQSPPLDALETPEITEPIQTPKETKKAALRAKETAKTGNVEPLHKSCVEWFCEKFYPAKYPLPYKFRGGKDGEAVSQIITYIRTAFPEFNENQVFAAFKSAFEKSTNWKLINDKYKLTTAASEISNILNDLMERKQAERKAAEQAKLNALTHNQPQNEQPKIETYSQYRAG